MSDIFREAIEEVRVPIRAMMRDLVKRGELSHGSPAFADVICDAILAEYEKRLEAEPLGVVEIENTLSGVTLHNFHSVPRGRANYMLIPVEESDE